MKRTIRYETDSLGKIAVPIDRYWGANTQRSLIHFTIGTEIMPLEFIRAYVLFKKCAAQANYKLKLLNKTAFTAITRVCNDILDNNTYNKEFPLYIWQTGSGTHTNMNINEVISNICNEKLTGKLGTKTPIHPNDHVNMSQSSNDTFITAIHISTALMVNRELIPNLEYMINGLKQKQRQFKDIIKLGRTHLQDAVPLTFGQEFSGYVALLEDSLYKIKYSLGHIYQLAAGGSAVGTGINTHPRFAKLVALKVSKATSLPFITASNKFAEMSSHNAVLSMSDSLKLLATNIMKITNDIRLLASGPRAGLSELILPTNEAGSSIMPGKTNPTQCEAASMVAIQVIANNTAITFANTQGHFELNVYNPLMLYNITQSISLLSDVCNNFTKYCVLGIQVNKEKVNSYLENALTLATILNPIIGYDKASKLAQYAYDKNISLKEANKVLQFLSENDMNKYLDPKQMIVI
uniref:fumarate hydratase n=1 Tax=viral metagenome TaxID=1070528 RepID=A0A6C0LLX0_9ZZZZ